MYKKGLNDLDKHDGVVTPLEPGILECEVKWALGRIAKNIASGGDGIPAEQFKILNNDAVKMLRSVCQDIWKTPQWLQDWKSRFHSNTKECSNSHTIGHISHASEVMLTILQARPEQMNQELPNVHSGFRKGRGSRDQIANIRWITEEVRESRKTSTPASLTTLEPLTVWITTNCGKFLKRWEYRTTLPVS